MSLQRLWLAALAALWMGTAASQPARSPRRVVTGLVRFLAGNPADVARPTRFGLILAGGGTDVDAAMQFFGERAGAGDLVVLRAGGGAGYNQYLLTLTGADSVETLVVPSRQRAEDPYVLTRLRQAEGVFITGGDQADYVNFWGDTSLAGAIEDAVRRGAPLGGTSAGLAILGEWVFAALHGAVSSAEALADPYHPRVTLVRNVVRLPRLFGTITDSHFAARDRMGRLLAFLARLLTDEGMTEVRGVGVDEGTALLVDEAGLGVVVGRGAVYFLRPSGRPERCVPGEPLTFRGVSVQRAVTGQEFSLPTWSGAGVVIYTVSVEDGRLISTQAGGRIY